MTTPPFSPSLSSSAVVTVATGTVQQFVDYYIATMGCCTPAALIAALHDGYIKLPGLTIRNRQVDAPILFAAVALSL